MKKLLLILLCLPMIGFGQTPAQNFDSKLTLYNSINAANAANRAANAANAANAAANAKAQDEEMKNNSTVINIDLLINNSDKYTAVVLDYDNIKGWKTKVNFKTILETLETSNTMQTIITSQKGSKRSQKKYLEKKLKDFLPNQILYFHWHREAISSYSRVTTLTLKDSKEKIIFKATYKNEPYFEMLKPLLIDYVFTKEMALAKMKEVKEWLDLGIISKQEFNEFRAELKPIIIGK